MGLYEHEGDGVLSLLAGRGRAEYGASTVRKVTTTFTVPGNNGAAGQDITFSTPMPDADYLVSNPVITDANDSHLIFDVCKKTANGFRLYVTNEYIAELTFNVEVYAFKLYTDTEYNDVLDEVRDSGWIKATATAVLASGDIYYRTIGSLCVVRGENIKISSTATTPTDLVTGVPTCKYQPSNNIFVRSTGMASEGTIWINPNDTSIRTCIPSGLAGQAVSINLSYFID